MAAVLQARRVERLGPRAVALAFWILLPLLCLIFTASATDKIIRHVNDVPAGIRGAFFVTSHNCQQQICITGGTFTSDDRTVVARDLLGVYSWNLGTKHRVVYSGNQVDVIPLPGRWDPTSTVVGLTGALLFLGIWAWCVAGLVRERRRAKPVDDRPSR